MLIPPYDNDSHSRVKGSLPGQKCALADLDRLASGDRRSGKDGVQALIEKQALRAVDYNAWLKLDAAEVERGKPKGKPREKFTRLEEMLAVLG